VSAQSAPVSLSLSPGDWVYSVCFYEGKPWQYLWKRIALVERGRERKRRHHCSKRAALVERGRKRENASLFEANCVSREREGEEEKASLFEASCVSRAREGEKENASLFEANCVSREREGEEEKASLPCGVVLLRAEALTIFIGRLEANCVCDEREKALLSWRIAYEREGITVVLNYVREFPQKKRIAYERGIPSPLMVN
jgi:hypothetical protein